MTQLQCKKQNFVMADYDGKQDSIFREPLVSVVYLYMYIWYNKGK